jgi:hypothetical protein
MQFLGHAGFNVAFRWNWLPVSGLGLEPARLTWVDDRGSWRWGSAASLNLGAGKAKLELACEEDEKYREWQVWSLSLAVTDLNGMLYRAFY